MLILHGTADKPTKPSGSQPSTTLAGSKDKTLKLYDGHFHDLLNDIDKEMVMADIKSWIDAHVPATRAGVAVGAVDEGVGGASAKCLRIVPLNLRNHRVVVTWKQAAIGPMVAGRRNAPDRAANQNPVDPVVLV